MNTRTVMVTRQLTMVKSIIVEIPAEITNDQLKSCLYDRCNVYDEVEMETTIYDMTEEDEMLDVEDSTEPATEDFSITDTEWLEALKADELLNEQ